MEQLDFKSCWCRFQKRRTLKTKAVRMLPKMKTEATRKRKSLILAFRLKAVLYIVKMAYRTTGARTNVPADMEIPGKRGPDSVAETGDSSNR